MTANQKQNKTYQDAIHSLKKINNELFYSELKTNMNNHVSKLDDSYSQTTEMLETMAKTVERLPISMHMEMQEKMQQFQIESASIMEQLSSTIDGRFQAREKDLQVIITNLKKIQNAYLQLIEHFKKLYQTQGKQLTTFIEEQKEKTESDHEQILKEMNETLQAFQEKQQSVLLSLETKLTVDIQNETQKTQEKLEANTETQKQQLEAFQQIAAAQTNTYEESIHTLNEKLTKIHEVNTQRHRFLIGALTIIAIVEAAILIW